MALCGCGLWVFYIPHIYLHVWLYVDVDCRYSIFHIYSHIAGLSDRKPEAPKGELRTRRLRPSIGLQQLQQVAKETILFFEKLLIKNLKYPKYDTFIL